MSVWSGEPAGGPSAAAPKPQEPNAKDPFGGESEEAFLSRIRQRLRPGPGRAHPGSSPLPPDHESRWSLSEKAAIFAESLAGLGGKVLRARDEEEAFRLVRDALVERGVRAVLTSGGDWSRLRALLGEAGVRVDSWDEVAFGHGEKDRDITRADSWDAGIAWADYAVADTGSIVLLASPGQGRSVSLVPPLFIALVPAGKLYHSRRSVLERVAAEAKARGVPSALTFITGPSRSADIENDLSIGVHGPGEVIAVLVGEAA